MSLLVKKILSLLALFTLFFFGRFAYLESIKPIAIDEKKLQIAPLPTAAASEEKPFVILVMSYNNAAFVDRNIQSILKQDYHNFRVIYIDDASTDDTLLRVKNLIKGREELFTLIHNPQNRGGMSNHWHAAQMCRDEEIMVIVDGDDFFSHPKVLSRLNAYYANPDVWITYSRHIEYPDYRQGICSKPLLKSVLTTQSIRSQPWQTSHLRTFYAGLFKKVKLNDFLHNGTFYPVTYDFACMFPMIEMAKEHTFHIPEVLYIYNLGNPLSDSRVHREKQCFYDALIRAQPRYKELVRHPQEKQESEKKSDLIIFSYDRPLQLYALLESIERNIKGDHQLFVLYRASDQRYAAAYEKVKERFPAVDYRLQPEAFATQSFKPMLMQLLTSEARAPYVLFAVDDIVVKDEIDLSRSIQELEKTQAYGFYLRLGEGIDYCYMENKYQGIPRFIPLNQEVLAWQFYTTKGDWNYPNTVDMTLYRKEDIIKAFSSLSFTNPANLEAKWAEKANHNELGLCYRKAKIVNLPLNVVSTTFANRHMHSFTPSELLEKFEEGLKMDITPLHEIKNCSAHMDYEPSFKLREIP